jgi:peptidylprolyl isomerase
MKKNPLLIIGAVILILFVAYALMPKNSVSNSDDVQTDTSSEQSQDTGLEKNIDMENMDMGKTVNVVLQTSKGDIELELFEEKMPITVGNFVKLAQEDFYDGVKFHRVMQNFMIQAGDPKTKDDSLAQEWGTGGPGYTIQDEFVEGLTNVRGTIAMANTGMPNSGGSQWFINVVDNTRLDFDKPPATSKHPVFGRVISGMDVVDAIVNVPATQTRPDEPVVINDVVVN